MKITGEAPGAKMTLHKCPFPLPAAPLLMVEGSGGDCMNIHLREIVSRLQGGDTLQAPLTLCSASQSQHRTGQPLWGQRGQFRAESKGVAARKTLRR